MVPTIPNELAHNAINAGPRMISLSHRFGRTLLGWSAVGLALSCSACATGPHTRTAAARNKPVQAIYNEVSEAPSRQGLGSTTAKRAHSTDIQQLSHNQPEVGVVTIRKAPSVDHVSHTEMTEASVRTQSPDDVEAAAFIHRHRGPLGGAPSEYCDPAEAPFDVECLPCEPRWAAAGPHPLAPGMTACDVCNLPSPENYADEYLCDGGDREIPVHYDAHFRRGLETEDTILEYTNRAGFERIRPSNRVCIYAPRFASVRTVSRPHEESVTDEVAGVGALASTGGMHTRLRAAHSVKREMTGRIHVRSRASGLESEALQGTVSQLRSPSVHDKLLNVYQSLTFVRFGKIEDSDTARLNYGIQAASLWTREEYPVIESKTDMALEGHFEQSTAVFTAIDDRESPEDLRIVKLADKNTAVSGDEIEFTIRYDNLGGKEVYHVRIVDNLTPRLEYIDDSATSDRDGRLVLQDNGEGSQILVWELDKPLPPRTGGVVTFKTKVR